VTRPALPEIGCNNWLRRHVTVDKVAVDKVTVGKATIG
jgi:hypothetical protein